MARRGNISIMVLMFERGTLSVPLSNINTMFRTAPVRRGQIGLLNLTGF
jgi:hypothetical protein